jgi:cytochrome c-type biogenesis protein CcmH
MRLSPARCCQLLAALLSVLWLSPSRIAWAENPIDGQVHAIASELQCPICAGQSVDESASQLAQQMRALIRRKLEDGESREQILAYFVDRYGESILREPPKVGFNQVLWWLPASGIAIGAVLLAIFLLRWRTRPATEDAAGPPPPPEDLAIFEQQLEQDLNA